MSSLPSSTSSVWPFRDFLFYEKTSFSFLWISFFESSTHRIDIWIRSFKLIGLRISTCCEIHTDTEARSYCCEVRLLSWRYDQYYVHRFNQCRKGDVEARRDRSRPRWSLSNSPQCWSYHLDYYVLQCRYRPSSRKVSSNSKIIAKDGLESGNRRW